MADAFTAEELTRVVQALDGRGPFRSVEQLHNLVSQVGVAVTYNELSDALAPLVPTRRSSSESTVIVQDKEVSLAELVSLLSKMHSCKERPSSREIEVMSLYTSLGGDPKGLGTVPLAAIRRLADDLHLDIDWLAELTQGVSFSTFRQWFLQEDKSNAVIVVASAGTKAHASPFSKFVHVIGPDHDERTCPYCLRQQRLLQEERDRVRQVEMDSWAARHARGKFKHIHRDTSVRPSERPVKVHLPPVTPHRTQGNTDEPRHPSPRTPLPSIGKSSSPTSTIDPMSPFGLQSMESFATYASRRTSVAALKPQSRPLLDPISFTPLQHSEHRVPSLEITNPQGESSSPLGASPAPRRLVRLPERAIKRKERAKETHPGKGNPLPTNTAVATYADNPDALLLAVFNENRRLAKKHRPPRTESERSPKVV
eukprot:TRINITY_DN28418_c0_g1_i1.p1 TRINITY_DN28418_c0_g1~~TRINITY_DN28418_c0_g1_i1.p1  ORF type:complete len:426 (-),score=36.05 TRINITY_DN28418_c0_g1_i1:48-1325(-)